jgi:capsular exopolysaccharide synthesis family protein
MSNVYKALERAERERRVVRPDEVTITDKLAEARVPVFHRPSDPYYLREYERLATEISHARAESALRTIMVTSSQHGEGTSTVSVNLALTLAERGRLNVLLVDANFRRPALRQIFHADGTGGLAELVSKEAGWAAAVKETANANLHLVTVGRPAANPSQFFELERFGELLDEFRTRFDITIFDAPPILPYADALTLASKVDRVIVVVQAGRTRRDRVERGKEELEKIGASIFGVVLNREKSYVPLWLQRYFNL